jgi:hypothetical protein
MASTHTIFGSSGVFNCGDTKKPLCTQFPLTTNNKRHQRIVDTVKTISNYPDIFERMWRSMMRPVEVCIEFNGGYFKHLL